MMTAACVLIKSPRAETYVEVAKRLPTVVPDLDSVEWVFVARARDDSLLHGAGLHERVAVTIRAVDSFEQLRPVLLRASVFDVSGLPKEDLVQVLGFLLERHSLRIYTLTKGDSTDYVDLMRRPLLRTFARHVFMRTLLLKILLLIACLALASVALLKILEWAPAASFWVNWLSIFIGLIGVVLGVLSLRARYDQSAA
jgi:hypothetical protein